MDFMLLPGEQLLMSGTANKWQTVGSKGGHLYLTNQRIIFKAHALNFGSKLDEYYLTNIWTQGNTVKIFTSSNLISFNITMYTQMGEKVSFVVKKSQKDEWIRQLTYAVSAIAYARNPVMQMQMNGPATQLRVTQCSGCGAFVILSGGTAVTCDYCNRPVIG